MRTVPTCAACLLFATIVLGQAPATTRPASVAEPPAKEEGGQDARPPASQPAGVDEAHSATVIKVVGNVSRALPGPDGKPGAFAPVKMDDKLPAGTLIKTSLRSKLMLAFGPDSVVLIDRVTLASIDAFHRSGDTKRVQLGLGHGLIRAATAETTLRSDMTITCPVATLSKRGTIDFGMRYEPGSGRYLIWLNKEGLIEALDLFRHDRRDLKPGEYVTQALLRWIDTITLDRYTTVTDNWGLTDEEQTWNAEFGSKGRGVIDPVGNASVYFTTYTPTSAGGRLPGFNALIPTLFLPFIDNGRGSVNRSEGNFGTGFGR